MTDVPVMTLAQYCPDLQGWPERCMFDETDIAAGQEIVAFFKPFLLSGPDKETGKINLEVGQCEMPTAEAPPLRRGYFSFALAGIAAMCY